MIYDDVFLNRKISYQHNAWAPLYKEISIYDALLEIKSDKHKLQITNLRNFLLVENTDMYNSHKRLLPAVTFCGTFKEER